MLVVLVAKCFYVALMFNYRKKKFFTFIKGTLISL